MNRVQLKACNVHFLARTRTPRLPGLSANLEQIRQIFVTTCPEWCGGSRLSMERLCGMPNPSGPVTSKLDLLAIPSPHIFLPEVGDTEIQANQTDVLEASA